MILSVSSRTSCEGEAAFFFGLTPTFVAKDLPYFFRPTEAGSLVSRSAASSTAWRI